MGISKASELDLIVYVDPVKYYNMPYREKTSVARLIGSVNWHYRDLRKHMMLIVPGRIGTTSPELGVPTSFADISASISLTPFPTINTFLLNNYLFILINKLFS